MEQTLREFKIAQKTKTPKSKNKVTNSWGVYDYYKYYRVNRPNLHEYVLDESTYFAIIRKVNKLLVDELCNSGEIEFPYRMGLLKMYKKEKKSYMWKDKVITTKRVDWDKTLTLWYNDQEAYKNKRVLYSEEKEFPIVQYIKANAIYKNKGYYNFSLCRDAKRKVKEAFQNRRATIANIYGKDEINQIKGLYDD